MSHTECRESRNPGCEPQAARASGRVLQAEDAAQWLSTWHAHVQPWVCSQHWKKGKKTFSFCILGLNPLQTYGPHSFSQSWAAASSGFLAGFLGC